VALEGRAAGVAGLAGFATRVGAARDATFVLLGRGMASAAVRLSASDSQRLEGTNDLRNGGLGATVLSAG
jgi:hypothetical protein